MSVTLRDDWPRWSDLRPILAMARTVFYGFATTWWAVDRRHLYHEPDSPIPCDPRGGVLMESDAAGFLRAAEADPDRYGKHGLDALAAAFHGSIIVRGGDSDGLPTCLKSWDDVNALIDEVREA